MNVFSGLLFHAIGGFCAASFYIPIKRIKDWSWESYWLVQGFASWIIAPILITWLTFPKGQLFNAITIVLNNHPTTAFWTLFFGTLWGIGGLTFGLSMRYLGMSLGYSITLGFCTIFGSLIPPIFHNTASELFTTTSGLFTFIGICITVLGITIIGYAGTLKENESREHKIDAIKEFALKKGLFIALLSGIMSACMAFAIDAGTPIRNLSVSLGANYIYSNNLVFIFIMFGGFITNAVWCLYLIYKNKNMKEFLLPKKIILPNILLAVSGGFIWYFQFFFYGIGERNLGDKYNFASWSIHMAFIIVFGNIWGLIFKEWGNSRRKILRILILGILILIFSTFIIGLGSKFG